MAQKDSPLALFNIHGSPFRPYQHMMADQVVRVPKGNLWSFMGSGKTAAVLTAIDRLILAGEVSRVLVLAPLRVAREVWPVEVDEWPHLSHLGVQPVIGTASERQAALRVPVPIHVVNYENIDWLIDEWGAEWPYDMIVLDESTKVKSLRASIRKNTAGNTWVQGQGGKRAKALLDIVFRTKTPRIVELTGTPSPNGLQDLWGQSVYHDYGKRLGRVFDAFKNRWFRLSWDGFGMDPLPHAQEQIIEALSDITMSLKPEDWFDVKAPIERTIRVTLPPDAFKRYREMEKIMFTEIEDKQIQAWNAGARTMKCRQIANGAAYTGDEAWVEIHQVKLDALEDIIEEAAGMPVLVAYSFKSDLARLMARFPKARHLDQRSETIKAWNEGKIPILLAHPGSAGHGLNLQFGSNILVYFSVDWNYEQHAQIAERLGPVRQLQSGLNRNVFYYYIVASKTVDEDIMRALTTKCSIQDALIEGARKRA